MTVSDEKLTQLSEKLNAMFGDEVADQEVFPRLFAYQVKLAMYQLALEEAQTNNPQPT